MNEALAFSLLEPLFIYWPHLVACEILVLNQDHTHCSPAV